jgi:hypothetical protein
MVCKGNSASCAGDRSATRDTTIDPLFVTPDVGITTAVLELRVEPFEIVVEPLFDPTVVVPVLLIFPASTVVLLLPTTVVLPVGADTLPELVTLAPVKVTLPALLVTLAVLAKLALLVAVIAILPLLLKLPIKLTFVPLTLVVGAVTSVSATVVVPVPPIVVDAALLIFLVFTVVLAVPAIFT